MAACVEPWVGRECRVKWPEGHMQWLDLGSGTALGTGTGLFHPQWQQPEGPGQVRPGE